MTVVDPNLLELDQESLAAIGRVAVKANLLEYAMAWVAHTAVPSTPNEYVLLGRTGAAMRAFAKYAAVETDRWLGPRLRKAAARADTVLQERHKIMHSLALFNFPARTPGAPVQYVPELLHPRSGFHPRPLVVGELKALSDALDRVANSIFGLESAVGRLAATRARAFADQSRTKTGRKR